MKNSLQLLLICLFLISGNVSSQINLQDSLLVHFISDATDQSGRGNHGTLTTTGVYPTPSRIWIENEAMFNHPF